MKKLVIGITGASGSIYARVLLDKLALLQEQIDKVGIVMSANAKYVWRYELGNEDYDTVGIAIEGGRVSFYKKDDFTAPFASGSAGYDAMIVCPCSMGTMGRIAAGISDDLITRAADVMLKERRKLVLVIRDTPYNLIHINNMKLITEAGGIICPATPSFYSKPKNFEELASTVIDRALHLAGFELKSFKWGE
ncbi:MAG: UbiX family flavin prenyltransferase [Chitinophagales bacterium]|nr:UbiX family flavin prenyltransferase [Bacteroidota bacterium]MBX7142438.1 UbiX family flavin prenyltransferase [Chitinophagales bacterium]